MRWARVTLLALAVIGCASRPSALQEERHRLGVDVSARTESRFGTNLYQVEIRNETGDTVTIESVAIDPLNITDVDVRDNHQAVNVVLEPAQTTIIGVWITITPRSRAANNIIVDSVRVTLSYRTDTRGFLQTEIRSVGRTR